jgi:3-hydroxyacyl-CoA dehydrogenase
LLPDEARTHHAFFAERGVAKIPDIPADTRVQEIRKAAIVGAGTMGGGIAMAMVSKGIPVILKDTDQAALDRGMATIRKNYDASIKRGRFTPEMVEQFIAQIHPQLTYDGFQEVDLILEAALKYGAQKKASRNRQDRQSLVLASNTSTRTSTRLLRLRLSRARIGLHFSAQPTS